jgi:hypothetical protein
MRYLVLDTCVLVNCTLMNVDESDPELLDTIAGRLRRKRVKFLLPSVIELEYERKVPQLLAAISAQTKAFRKSHLTTQALQQSDVSRLKRELDRIDSERSKAVDKARQYFASLAEDESRTIRVPLNGEICADAVTTALAGRKPAHPDLDRGLLDPDSLIVASVAHFARNAGLGPKDTVLICSDNHKDFATFDKDAGVHVIAPEIESALPCAVRYYKSPVDLLEKELTAPAERSIDLSGTFNRYNEFSETLRRVSASMDALRAVGDWNAALSSTRDMFADLPNVELLGQTKLNAWTELDRRAFLQVPSDDVLSATRALRLALQSCQDDSQADEEGEESAPPEVEE